jgi:hypothetical protein
MLDSDKQGKQMTEREKFYISKFQKEYLNLKEGCQLWQKPGYSTLSKKLPQVGYQQAVKCGLIPNYRKVGKVYLFRIKDIIEFLDKFDE